MSDDQAVSRWHHYSQAAHAPLTCLFFLFPFLAIYEIGVWHLNQSGEMSRNVGDALLLLFDQAGGKALFLPGLLLIAMLLLAHLLDRKAPPWRFSPTVMTGMLVECCVLSVGLLGIYELSVLAADHLDGAKTMAAGGSTRSVWERIVFYTGAGVFEEFVFRLLLVSGLFWGLRVIQVGERPGRAIAVLLAALAFSLVHHWGTYAEPFTMFAFTYRTIAGVFFGVIFLYRGFGIAAGTHAIYDILVGIMLPA